MLRFVKILSAFAFLVSNNPSLALKNIESIIMTKNDASVLRELKETINRQKEEISNLKSQLKGTKRASTPSHGAHGGGGEESIEDIATYLKKPFYAIAFKRVGWLSIFLVSLSFTAVIMNGFEHTLERQIELAYFVPLLAGHGGNTGGQTVGTVLSALSAGSISVRNAPVVVTKEALSGLMAGTILGMWVGPVAHFGMGISKHVSTVIALTIPLVSAIAATLGSIIPFACVALGLDPSVIAAPAMTSFVDVSGLMSYFLIANQVFKLFGIEL
ncbi:magnesium transporter [Fistulifera solaris]|uniref:Magnesium transporter n=1 Tax=Fistulifera solaris TaxID=1519565 RepID=A0A1Z5JPI5_FISSO|nr:magnesium transporter [Fistulifera solaris]|eukprot:GAX15806.1 magnesium transporter [Fistulifera solaris]